MRSYETIRIEDRGPLTWIVLNRPDKANALSLTMLNEFSDALQALAKEGGPVLAIRGEGKGFSAGFDISAYGQIEKVDPIEDRERLQRNLNRFLAIWDHPKPVIAAVHGYCIAGATQMCVYTDITFVTHDAKIGQPMLPLGGGYIGPTWAPLVGPKRAKEFSFVAGNTIDGRTAVEWGWANHSVDADHLIPEVEAFAARIALVPSEILRIKKLSINRAMEAMGIRQATASISEMDALLHMSSAVAEVRALIGQVGLKQAIARFRGEPTSAEKPSEEQT
jgi:enoyl-CoA hydratase/carnithine racemase